jgi:hypothetical protein
MDLTASERAQIQASALRYLAKRLGLAQADAELSIQFETLTIQALSPEIIDYLNENQSELIKRAYLSTGIRNIDITFIDEPVLSFEINCESFDTSAENMVATLESPVESTVETAPETAQVELPLTDIQAPEPEELCTIEDLIAHVSRRTNQNVESLRNTIDSMTLTRYRVRGVDYVSTKAVGRILARWAEAVACDVQMSLHYEEIRPEPVQSVAKPATKTGTKNSAAKTPAKKPAAKKVPPKQATEAAAE